MKKKIVIIVTLLATVCLLRAQTIDPNSVAVEAVARNDSIDIKVTVTQIETQLTFLMQGLHVRIIQPDTLTVSFPSASMVRHKVRRHPNEVKAVLASRLRQQAGQDSLHHIVRPDVQPLVAALNDTTATIAKKTDKASSRNFYIDVDRERAVMTFTVTTDKALLTSLDGVLNLLVSSAPSNHQADRPEFAGRRLSGENAPRPNGLGEGIRQEDMSKRTFQKMVSVKIK